MGDGIYTALTGAMAQQGALDVVANNVANAATTGYRADRAVFSEFLAGAQSAAAKQVPGAGGPPRSDRFVRLDEVVRDVQAGALRRTDNPLDVALQGDGFFSVQDNNGMRLTRSGNFMLRSDGVLSTSEGLPVLGADRKAIRLPTDGRSIVINGFGEISVDDQLAARLGVVKVAEPEKLEKLGATYFAPGADAKLSVVDRPEVIQGHLETSNVNAVAGLNDLITINRSFDALQRVIETFQKLDERAARELGSRNS